MNLDEISLLRLQNQCLFDHQFSSAAELAGFMGAMQAQDFAMSRWALGIRLGEHGREKDIFEAINQRKLIRTHVLRPTWHIVASEHIRWMLDLTGKKILNSMKSRHQNLELDDAALSRSLQIIENSLKDVDFLSRESLGKELASHGFKLDQNRLSHLLLYAELKALICNGKINDNKITYALFDKWVPEQQAFSKEEALQKLAFLYFRSHGPATIDDFMWWSGLNGTQAKTGIHANSEHFQQIKLHDKTYFLVENKFKKPKKDTLFLLPAYDEFIISYKYREASISEQLSKKAISNNGIFRPIIVFNGKVVGLWKKEAKNNLLKIEASFFEKPSDSMRQLIESQANILADFWEKTNWQFKILEI